VDFGRCNELGDNGAGDDDAAIDDAQPDTTTWSGGMLLCDEGRL
jgi:hypothetical protein